MKKLLLVLILAAALLLRVYHVAIAPPSLSWDEVSIGYNAYSILKTGKDEHGKFMPLDAFAAYGDYKPPLAIYVTVPFVAVFGLTDFAVRLPAALFGVLTIVAVYYLVCELFPGKTILALLASFLLAISPWHINISRGGFEANIAHFFIVLGIWLVLSARKKPSRFIYMWIPFICAIYLFNSARYFVPFIGLILAISLYKIIRNNLPAFCIGIVISMVLMLPILPHLLSKEARLRFQEVNIFTDASVVVSSNARMARESNLFTANLFNNRRIGFIRSFFMHFTDNLDPLFLFIKGDGNPKFSIQDVGQMYVIEAPLLAIGFFTMVSAYPRIAVFLLAWLLTSIIPAATARETPHALRILNTLPTWQIFIAYGMLYLYKAISKKPYSHIFRISVIGIYTICFSYYIHTYYSHYPVEYSGEWQYGYREALRAISTRESSYDKIVISEKIGRAYMYTLFYSRADPSDFMKTKQSYFDSAGFYHVTGFSKYSFGQPLSSTLDSKTLYVWDSDVVPKGVHVLETIRLLNGKPVLSVFDTGRGVRL